MKKLFFLLACVVMSLLSYGQNNQLVWANGRLLYGSPIESIDSLTYDEMEDVDTLHLLLPRTLIKVVHDTVVKTEVVHDTIIEIHTQIVHDTVYIETDCGEDTPSAGIGTFSVSADKQVTFSKGNLQYTQSTNTWSFAENQWDMIGTDNVTGGDVYSTTYGDEKDGTALADKVDIFGWSGSTGSAKFGVSTSEPSSDYSGSFVDWGTNQIGADAPNIWRTLTYDEWRYVVFNRPNKSSLKGVAQVNGVNGLILLPDTWVCPEGVTFKSGYHSEWSVEAFGKYQTFTVEQWSKLESAGAVFLPASGGRSGSNVYLVQGYGYYWSATGGDGYNAYYLSLPWDEAYVGIPRYYGLSVRLVKDL